MYINVYIIDKKGFVDFSRVKNESALSTLRKIDHILKENLWCNESWKSLQKLASEIKKNYFEKSSKLSFLRRYFGGVAKKEKAILEILKSINLVRKNKFSTDSVTISCISKFLTTTELFAFSDALLEKSAANVIDRETLKRAQKYGYEGKDVEGGKNYLGKLYKGLRGLYEEGTIPKKIFCF